MALKLVVVIKLSKRLFLLLSLISLLILLVVYLVLVCRISKPCTRIGRRIYKQELF